MTQANLAKVAAVAVSLVGKVERGEPVSETTMRAISHALELPGEMVAPYTGESREATQGPGLDPTSATVADLNREYYYFAGKLSPQDMQRLSRLLDIYHRLQHQETIGHPGTRSHTGGDI